MNTAKFIMEITVDVPDDGDTQLAIYQHEGGGIFAIESSFVDQMLGDDEDDINVKCVDPLSDIDCPQLVLLIERED